MKCYYEVLGISRNSSEDEIKKAYRKLALQWHPDKNPSNIEEAKKQFLLVQQAYEVLGDGNERTWYDNHRESILKGGAGSNYVDNALDVFQFFTTSCFVGYGDDEKGFYSVYREVFNKISAEDSEYNSDMDSDFEIPTFGKSDSSFDDVVQPFYSYWQSYLTKKSYAWLNVYDIKEAPTRKVARLMEKDNKKVRDEARKERNEEVRALVQFVKKRDKRVQAHAIYLKEKKEMNLKKTEAQRQMKIKERKEEIASYQESDWSKFSNFEKELKDIEATLTAEFGDNSVSDRSSEDDDSDSSLKNDTLYCVACNKVFKTSKAFQNHENSKKHKENVAVLKMNVLEEDDTVKEVEEEIVTEDENLNFGNKGSYIGKENEVVTNTVEEHVEDSTSIYKLGSDSSAEPKTKKNKKYKKKNNSVVSEEMLESEANSTSNFELDDNLLFGASKRQKKNILRKQILLEKIKTLEESDSDSDSTDMGQNKNVVRKDKKKRKSKKLVNVSSKVVECNQSDSKVEFSEELPIDSTSVDKASSLDQSKVSERGSKQSNVCQTCESSFSSKNKLFDHLKKSGHAVYLQSKVNKVEAKTKKKINK